MRKLLFLTSWILCFFVIIVAYGSEVVYWRNVGYTERHWTYGNATEETGDPCDTAYCDTTMTACDSFIWRGVKYTETPAEALTDTIAGGASNGCDSIVIMHLVINNTKRITVDSIVCGSISWLEHNYSESGTYVDTLTAVNGCDSIVTLHLTVNHAVNTGTVIESVESFVWHREGAEDTTITTSGTYTHTHPDANGCSQTDTIHLTVYHATGSQIDTSACEGFVWQRPLSGDTTLLASGIYHDTLSDVHGADSVVTLVLTIKHGSYIPLSVTQCDSYFWHDSIYTENGTSVFEYRNDVGCPSADTLHLVINHAVNTGTVAEAVEAFVWHRSGAADTTITNSGTYTHTHPDANGCAQTDTIHLTVYHATGSQIDTSACEGFVWQRPLSGDTTLLASGIYHDTLSDVHGADSVVTLVLTIKHGSYIPLSVTQCDSYFWHDSIYTENGTSVFEYRNDVDCPSADTLHLVINHAVNTGTVIESVESFVWHREGAEDTTITTSGTYTHTHPDANGCSQTDTIHLTVYHATGSQIDTSACEGFVWQRPLSGDTTLLASGIYHDTLSDVHGADSVVTLVLTIKHGSYIPLSVTQCDSYFWHDSIYTENGTSVFEYRNDVDCPSADTLHLVINHAVNTDTVAEAVETFVWHREGTSDTIITTSGTYTYTHPDANGCTQTDTLHLTVYHATGTLIDTSACESFVWQRPLAGDTILTKSGIYYDTLFDVHHADSIVTLDLTINHGSYIPSSVAECDSYTWHDSTYIENGTYVFEYINNVGCPSADTLHLVINQKHFFSKNDTVTQGSLPYNWHGHSLYANTTIYDSLQTAAGCDSVFFLTLTITPFNIVQDNPIVLCQGETENWRGYQLSQSGIYRDTTLAENTIHTVEVTVNPKYFFQENVTVNQGSLPYNWHGHSFYADTIVYDSLKTVGTGCDSVHKLTLTVTSFTVIQNNPIALCQGETRTWRGYQLTESREYRDTVLSENTIYTVLVTVNAPATGTVSISGDAVICQGGSTTLTASTTGNTGVMKYHWNAGGSQANNETITVSPAASIVYSVTATATVGNCTATTTKSVTVTVNPLPAVSIEGDMSICENNPGTLTAIANPSSSQYSWSWSNGEMTPSITVYSGGLYSVTVTDGRSHCQNSSSATVQAWHLPQTPQCSVQPNSSCSSNNGSITVSVPNGNGFSYSINNEDFQSSNVFSSLVQGSYIVIVKDNHGCINTTSVYVDANGNTVDAQATANTPCAGQNITLFGSSSSTGVTYSWTGPNNFSSEDQNPTIQGASPSKAGYYILTVTQESTNCKNYVRVQVQVNAPSVTLSDIADRTVCAGRDITLNADPNLRPTGEVSYQWITPRGNYPTQNHTIHSTAASDAGTYTIIATAAQELNGSTCYVYDTVSFIVYVNNPQVMLNPMVDTSVCVNGNLQLTASVAGTETVNYAWIGPNNSSHEGATWSLSNITAANQGAYQVTATTTQELNGVSCTASDTTSISVTVNPLPNVFVSGEDSTCAGVSTPWTASGANSYLWSNNSTSNQIQVIEASTYTVEGTDTNGCVKTATKTLTVNVPQPVTTQHTACESYEWHDSTYTISGIYTYGHTDAHGCMQVDTLKLTINYGTHNSDAVSECNQFTWNAPSGMTYTVDSTSVLVDHYNNDVNCPSADTLHVIIRNSPIKTVYDTVCQHEVYIFRGVSINTDSAGVFTYEKYDGRDSETDCDSLQRLILTVNPVYNDTLDATVCDEYVWDNSVYDSTGIYTRTFSSQSGCDSIVTIRLTVYYSDSVNLYDTICAGSRYQQHGFDTLFPQHGSYELTNEGYTIHNCDSTTKLFLWVNPLPNVVISGDSTICAGDTITWSAMADTVNTFLWLSDSTMSSELQVSASGSYTVEVTDTNNCKNTATMSLTVNPLPNVVISGEDSICAGYATTWTAMADSAVNTYLWLLDNTISSELQVSVEGEYTVKVTDTLGCMNTASKFLTVNPVYQDTLDITVCEGAQYYLDTTIVEQYTSLFGCDSNTVKRYHVVPRVTLIPLTDKVICMFDSVDLVANVQGGENTYYIWMHDGSNQQSIRVSPQDDSTQYWVRMTDTTIVDSVECVSQDTASVWVYVKENPPLGWIDGDTTLCQNQYYVYHYSDEMDEDEYEYTWYWNGYTLEGTDEATIYTPILESGSDTTYSLAFRVTSNEEPKCYSEALLSVHVCPFVTPSKVTVLRKGTSNILYCDSASVPTHDPVKYQWGYTVKSTGSDYVPNPNWNQRFYNYQNGIDTAANYYWVETSIDAANNLCVNRSYYLYDPYDSPVAVEDIQVFDVRAYVRGDLLIVDVDNPMMQSVHAEIYDLRGRLLNQYSLGNDAELHTQLPISYAKGVYVLKLTIGNHIYSTKIIR